MFFADLSVSHAENDEAIYLLNAAEITPWCFKCECGTLSVFFTF
jgi:hypothetical protein